MAIDRWIKRWHFPKSTGEGEWVVGLDRDGSYGCSCPVWKFKRMECKHIKRVKEEKLFPSEAILAKALKPAEKKIVARTTKSFARKVDICDFCEKVAVGYIPFYPKRSYFVCDDHFAIAKNTWSVHMGCDMSTKERSCKEAVTMIEDSVGTPKPFRSKIEEASISRASLDPAKLDTAIKEVDAKLEEIMGKYGVK